MALPPQHCALAGKAQRELDPGRVTLIGIFIKRDIDGKGSSLKEESKTGTGTHTQPPLPCQPQAERQRNIIKIIALKKDVATA